MYLGAEVGAEIGGRHGDRPGHRCRERQLLAAGRGGPSGVPHRAGGEFGGHRHVGAVVFDRLEHGDRSAELDALLGIRGRHVGALGGHADRLCGHDDPRQIGEDTAGTREQHGRSAIQRDPSRAPGRIHVLRDVHRHTVAEFDDGNVVTDADEEHLRQATTQHVPGVAGGDSSVDADVAGQCHCPDDRAISEPGEMRVRSVAAHRSEHCTGQDRRHERTRSHGPTELFDDHDEFLE